jgi:serine/threonine protein kinase
MTIADGMLNYLHILHFHLNHATNKHVVPLILGHLSDMKPYPAGQRLLKLLCMDLNDTSLYRGWRKLAFGAYGTIYECHTELAHPQEVAIKVAPFKASIYDRCVLHDIFAEITCLEYFRLQPNVTTLFDYGVAKGQYYIVMKKYKMSLRRWREEQTKGLDHNLPLYLEIFHKVLMAVRCLHNNNITHYDLKCDNVLVNFDCTEGETPTAGSGQLFITLADFGECK